MKTLTFHLRIESKDLKEKIENLAKEENRSINNLINTILKKHLRGEK
ncbi:hypothetical protein [Cetobacterium sp.]